MSLKEKLRNLILPKGLLAQFESMQLAQGRLLAELNRSRLLPSLNDCEFRIFSQWGEDGIIQRLLNEVPIANSTFIEFGVENFVESNCRFLMMNNNWSGFVIDGSQHCIDALYTKTPRWKYDLRAVCRMITRENINQVLGQSGFDADLGLISIDVDGVDYWLWEAMDTFAPRIVIVEYNALFGCDRAITVPYDPAFVRAGKHYSELFFGASLPAFENLAARKGYSLVCTETAGVNAFFVRNDALGDRKAVPAAQAFRDAKVRIGKDRNGKLNYQSRDERQRAIRGLSVVNVLTGTEEPF
jgi:hypothetical protein